MTQPLADVAAAIAAVQNQPGASNLNWHDLDVTVQKAQQAAQRAEDTAAAKLDKQKTAAKDAKAALREATAAVADEQPVEDVPADDEAAHQPVEAPVEDPDAQPAA